ncbi:P-type conjugative transfer protein VirB9 [Iodobacter fluviatilis]|uniref:P-type conjugative transfer protein VirB9 n=1 Tax=Iodobacter fluviatilis TaxID=537 RepID=A0A7G3GG25_9NEIS|nr:P-type conjugative transfer protein VirB9 [Iodobacter fluviatilis]QBC45842.1 P-type conjugative transfer protein VirB9 [Iodobacter fluviatilis]QBC45895.1 P-type conjugative transfer protein VirB9 [Iodobacter fluviatilis]
MKNGIKNIVIAMLIAGVITPAIHAAEVPVPSMRDARTKLVQYNADEVYTVNTYPGIATRIILGEGETVTDIATGFSTAWEIADRGNVIYVKPKQEKADTNMLVVTNKREYQFDLIMPNNPSKTATVFLNNRNIAYTIRFSYPEDVKVLSEEALKQATLKEKLAAQPIPKNWKYSMMVAENSSDIKPSEAFDDGRFTYIKFAAGRSWPAIFQVQDDKTEKIVNSNSEGEYMVIHKIGREFVLRQGKQVVGLYNDAYNPDGVPTATGVTVDGVERKVIAE